MNGTLDGILVVALEQAVAAPLATSRLADAGARVIKLERREGDFARGYDNHAAGHATYFVWLNRGKESCRVDLGSAADRALVRRMLSAADVFVQNLGPGAADRLGLGSETLRREFPRLITCDIRGYAAGTPHAERKAYDLMIQAESGLADITGTASSGPSRIGVSICDIATGMTAHAQILEALYRRTRTGEGSAISVALFDVAAELMSVPYLAVRNGGPAPRRVGLAHPSIAPYGVFGLRDGSLLVAVQSDREWASFASTVLDAPALATDPRFATNSDRVANRPTMDAMIQDVFSTLTVEAAIARLDAARIAHGRVSTLDDLVRHDALSVATCLAGDAEIHMVAGPAVVDGRRTGGGRVPEIGEHDGALREEFA